MRDRGKECVCVCMSERITLYGRSSAHTGDLLFSYSIAAFHHVLFIRIHSWKSHIEFSSCHWTDMCIPFSISVCVSLYTVCIYTYIYIRHGMHFHITTWCVSRGKCERQRESKRETNNGKRLKKRDRTKNGEWASKEVHVVVAHSLCLVGWLAGWIAIAGWLTVFFSPVFRYDGSKQACTHYTTDMTVWLLTYSFFPYAIWLYVWMFVCVCVECIRLASQRYFCESFYPFW